MEKLSQAEADEILAESRRIFQLHESEHLDLDLPDGFAEAYPEATIVELALMNHQRKLNEDVASDHSGNRKASEGSD